MIYIPCGLCGGTGGAMPSEAPAGAPCGITGAPLACGGMPGGGATGGMPDASGIAIGDVCGGGAPVGGAPCGGICGICICCGVGGICGICDCGGGRAMFISALAMPLRC
jgi:hypothetical protein